MTRITLLDTTVRDGNQSNWGATGLDTAMMLGIAPAMDRVGFEAIDFTTSTHMAVAVRFSKQDPWERLRLFRAAAPKTKLSFLTTGMRFISWETASHELMASAPMMMRTGASALPCWLRLAGRAWRAREAAWPRVRAGDSAGPSAPS